MQIFKLNDKYSAVCKASNTRNGFKHTATLMVDGRDTGHEVKCNYLNRTWEAYTYQSVLYKLVEKCQWFDADEKRDITNKVSKGDW